MTSMILGDIATGSYTKSSVGGKRLLTDDDAMDSVSILSAVSDSTAEVTTSPPAVLASPTVESVAAVASTPVPPLIAHPSVPSATASSVRPYARRVRARPADTVPDLIREIIMSQEKFASRMTKYDKVIQIFQERFMFGLSMHQEMGFIALFSENPCLVDQFFVFNEAQRDVFVQARKLKE